MQASNIPEASYGILLRDGVSSPYDSAAEEIRNLGYTVLDAGYSATQVAEIAEAFDNARKRYIARYGQDRLAAIDELNTIRSMLTQDGQIFRKVALNANLVATLKLTMSGKFIINQQNGIINPPGQKYNQGAWHRDLPYQHFVCTRPLAVNALYCVDDFTIGNGATFVLPASHKSERFPSDSFVRNNAIQIEAKAGSYIVLDCMLFHSGGFNSTQSARRAINHVYNIPFFKQQINLTAHISPEGLTPEEMDIIGFAYVEPASIEDYLAKREAIRK